MKNGFIPPEAKKKQSFVPPEVKKKASTDSPSTLEGGSSSLGSEGANLDFLDKTFTPEDFGISTQSRTDQAKVDKPTDVTESPTAFIQPKLIRAAELLQEVDKKEEEFIRNSEPYQQFQALEQQAEPLLSEIQSYPKELPEDKLEVANQKIGRLNEIIERMDALSAQIQEIPNELGTNRERNKLLQEMAGDLSLAYPNEKLITGEMGVSMTEGEDGGVSEVDFISVEDLRPTGRFFEALADEIGKELKSGEQVLMEQKYGDMGALNSTIQTPLAAFNEPFYYLAKLPFLALGGTKSEGYQFFNDLEKEQAEIKRAARLSTMTAEEVDGGVTKNLADGNYSAAAKNLGYDVLDGMGQVGSIVIAPNVGISRTGSMTLGRVSQDVLAKQPLFQGGRGIRAKARGVQQKIGEQGMNLGMVAMSGKVAEDSYNEDIELGLHPLTATVAATVKGLAVMLTESMFTSDLAAVAGTPKGRMLADELIKNKGQVVRSYYKQIPQEFREKAGEEFTEEFAEGSFSGTVDYLTKGTPINPYQLADQGLAGLGSGGVMGAGGALRTALSVQRTDAEQLKLQKRINKINNFLENNRGRLSQSQISALSVELDRLNPKLAKLVEARDAIFEEFSEEDTNEYLRLSQEIAQNLDALNESGSERLDADTMGEVFDGLRESTKALLDERKAIEDKYMESEEMAEDGLPKNISELNDNDVQTLTYASLDEVPDSLKDKAKESEGGEVPFRRFILGIPIGKKQVKKVPSSFVVVATGAEIKEAARQEMAKQKTDEAIDPTETLETTTSALEQLTPEQKSQELIEGVVIEGNEASVAEAYQQAKQDGSNPELVQAVENLLNQPQTIIEEKVSSKTQPDIVETVETEAEGSVQKVTESGTTAFNEGVESVQQTAKEYRDKIAEEQKQKQRGYQPDRVNPPALNLFERVSKMMADAYQSIKNEPTKAEVKKAYDALVSETKKQYEFIKDKGLKVIKHEGAGEPYANSKEMLRDIRENNTLKFLPNDVAFGEGDVDFSDNIGLQSSGIKLEDGYELTNSEVFRIVHDYFGHGILGNQFGPIGEENATLQHLDLYSDEAAPAVIFQTRGQNSWVNFSGVNKEANDLRKQARELRKQGETKKADELVEQANKLFKFAEPKIAIFPTKFNFKRYETARRINEQETIDSRPNKRTNVLPRLLEKYSERSRRTRGVNKKSVRGIKRLGTFDLNVIAEYTLDNKISEGIKKAFPNFKGVQKIYEVTDGDTYRKMMEEALKDNPFAASVTVHSAEKFNGMRMFVTEDGSTGITLTKEGFLGGAFSNPNANRPQNLAQLMVIGIKEGATTAEAFDTTLPDYYSKFGFKAVSRTSFNEELKPMVKNGDAVKDWDFETYKRFNNGRPDLVFFIYDGGDRNTIEDRLGLFDLYKNYEKANTKSFDKNGYDKAEEVMKQQAVKRLEFELKTQDATKEPSPTEVPVGEQPTTSQEVREQDTQGQETPQEAKEQTQLSQAVTEYRKRIQEGKAKPSDFAKAIRGVFKDRKGKVTAKEAGSLAASAVNVTTEKQLEKFEEKANRLLDKAEKRSEQQLRKKKVGEIKEVFDSLIRKGTSLAAKVAPAQSAKIKEIKDNYTGVNLAELSENEFNDLYSLIMEYNEIGRANQKKINKLRNAQNARMSGRMASLVMGQGQSLSEVRLEGGRPKTKKLSGEEATKRAIKIAAKGGVISVNGQFFYSKNRDEMKAMAKIDPNFFDNAEVFFVPPSIKHRKESLFQKMKSYVNLDFKTLLYKMSFTEDALNLMDEVYREVAKGTLLSGGVKQHYKVQEQEFRKRLLGKRGKGLHLLDEAVMDGEPLVVIAEGQEDVILNNSQALQLYMLASRVNSQLDKVIGTIGEDGIMRVIEYVKSKPELLEYANSMFDLYSETLPAINEALEKLGQKPIQRNAIKSTENEVKNRVITALFDGDPPQLEPYAPADITSTAEADDSKLFMNESGTNIKFYADSMKELTAGGVVTLTGVQENFVNYVDQISHMVAMADAYRMLGEVFNNGNMRIIKKKMGENFHNMLRDQINDIVAGRVVSQKTDSKVSFISNWARRQAGIVMFFNMRSAIGQSLSSTNNIVEHQSVPDMLTYLGHFFKGIVSNKDRKEFASLDVVQRRKEEKGASEDFHDFIGNKKNISKAGEIIDDYLTKGYFLTKAMDFNAVVISGAPYYRMILDDLKKQKPNASESALQEEAAVKAMTIAEEVQQSSKIYTRSYLEKNALLRFLLTFQKVPLQYSRRVQQAFKDLRVGRGSATMNVIKIAYYGAIQNLMFNAFQMATKAIFKFEDEDEDEFTTRKKQQVATALNRSLDSFLIGWGGWYGLAISKGKNVLYDLAKALAEANLEDGSRSSGRPSRGSGASKEAFLLDPSAWEDLYRAITLMEEDQRIIKSGYRDDLYKTAVSMVPVADIMIRTGERASRVLGEGETVNALMNGVQAVTGAPIAVSASRGRDIIQGVELVQKANHAADIGDRFEQYAIALTRATNILTEYDAKKAGIVEDDKKKKTGLGRPSR